MRGVKNVKPGDRVLVSCITTHNFALDEFEQAYDVFSRAAETGALKVVLHRT